MASKSVKARKKNPTGGRPTPGGGRVTPKGGQVRPRAAKHAESDGSTGTDWAAESARYAASLPRTKASPPWWPILVFGLLGLGILLIVLDYAGVLPGTPNNWMLIPAVLCLGGGLFALMGYR